MIKRIDERKKLTKHIYCKRKYKFGGKKCSSNRKWEAINVGTTVKMQIYIYIYAKKLTFGQW